MAAVQRVGDRNAAGGVILNGDTSVFVNGRAIAVQGASVSAHPPCPKPGTHCNAKTQPTNSTVLINGKQVILTNDTDTCGHKRTGGSTDVFIG